MILIDSRWSHGVFALIVFSQFSSQWVSADYCTIPTCHARQHTMCLFSSNVPSKNCVNYITKPLTQQERLDIVAKHNEYREKVASGGEARGNPGPQPPANNMRVLTWDNELAEIAQRYADQCLPGHDTCRNVDRFIVGQNIVTQCSTADITMPLAELTNGWYNEASLFNPANVKNYQFDASWGHYSQLV